MSTTAKSILIIGASGGTGLAVAEKLSKHSEKPTVHGFCRDPTKLSMANKKLFTSVIQGNARSSDDLKKALEDTEATTVIVSIGNGENVSKTDIRTVSAQQLVKVLEEPQFEDVRIVVISSTGAGKSKIIVGMGIGKLISFHLRHILKDHTGQEAAFAPLHERTTIVRATALTTNKETGKLVIFGDKKKSPTIKTDRGDLADWIVEDIYTNGVGEKIVNVTGTKK